MKKREILLVLFLSVFLVGCNVQTPYGEEITDVSTDSMIEAQLGTDLGTDYVADNGTYYVADNGTENEEGGFDEYLATPVDFFSYDELNGDCKLLSIEDIREYCGSDVKMMEEKLDEDSIFECSTTFYSDSSEFITISYEKYNPENMVAEVKDYKLYNDAEQVINNVYYVKMDDGRSITYIYRKKWKIHLLASSTGEDGLCTDSELKVMGEIMGRRIY